MSDYINLMINEGGTLGYVVLFVGFGFSALLFYTLIGLTTSFITNQVKNIYALYKHSVPTDGEFHPYTKSILNNSCPELQELATLKRQGNTEEMKEVLHAIITTLREKETNAIKYDLINQFKAIQKGL